MQGRRGRSRKDTECGGCGSGENMWRVGMGSVLSHLQIPSAYSSAWREPGANKSPLGECSLT